jgi:lysophospholipid acyltransferase 1/2
MLIFLLKAAEIIAKPIWYRVLYCHISVLLIRTKFYLAWILGDAVNNASGLGFNGYDQNGKSKWDLITNATFLETEVKYFWLSNRLK